MSTTMRKSDADLKTDVLAELGYEPTVRVTDIGVLVQGGAVTLNGYTSNYGEKWAAVRATRRVAGVKAIADDIVVKVPDSQYRTDGEIASEAAEQIHRSTTIPTGTLEVTVREGQITLAGEVEWWYQKHAAENALEHLVGLRGVTSLITIAPTETPSDVIGAINRAFERNAMLDELQLQVEGSGSDIVLRGKVRNHFERDEAERVAWGAHGVHSVTNQLDVEWPWARAD